MTFFKLRMTIRNVQTNFFLFVTRDGFYWIKNQ